MNRQDTENSTIRLEEGQLRVTLNGSLDVAGLSRDLREKGYFLANDPEDNDSQGWGKDFDAEGYYPNWVFRDGEKWIFASTPKDFGIQKDGDRSNQIGERSKEEMGRWVTYLQNWCIG